MDLLQRRQQRHSTDNSQPWLGDEFLEECASIAADCRVHHSLGPFLNVRTPFLRSTSQTNTPSNLGDQKERSEDSIDFHIHSIPRRVSRHPRNYGDAPHKPTTNRSQNLLLRRNQRVHEATPMGIQRHPRNRPERSSDPLDGPHPIRITSRKSRPRRVSHTPHEHSEALLGLLCSIPSSITSYTRPMPRP